MIIIVLSTITLIVATLAKIVNSIIEEIADNNTSYLGLMGLGILVIWFGAAIYEGLSRWGQGVGEVLGQMLLL